MTEKIIAPKRGERIVEPLPQTNELVATQILAEFFEQIARVAQKNQDNGGGSPAGNHSLLTNLGADDHPQYLNTARGDLRYFSQSAVNTLLDGKKDDFFENTAFNKNFGTGFNDVCRGSDSRLSDARVPLPHTHVEADITDLDKYTKAEVNAIVDGQRLRNPVFTYTGDFLTDIAYSDGKTKTLSYNLDEQLTQLVFFDGVNTITKQFNYNIDGTLASVSETVT